MRNDFTPQVETREINDADLDGVAGGVGVGILGISLDVPVSGIVGNASGLTGLTTTGISTLPGVSTVTGLVAGL
jgi:hypothetical protein